jgi:hypothetical protein
VFIQRWLKHLVEFPSFYKQTLENKSLQKKEAVNKTLGTLENGAFKSAAEFEYNF